MNAMKNAGKYWVGFTLLIVSTCASAVIPVYEIKEILGSSYLETNLTREIYRYTSKGNLHNLMVIDKDGNSLPYFISKESAPVNAVAETFPVKFYPVTAGTPAENLKSLGHTSIRITEQSIAVAVDVTPRDIANVGTAPVDFYLLDISNIDRAIDSLIIDWQASAAHQYLEVTLSGTQDLQRWTSLSQNTLVQLEKDGQTLTRNKIVLDLGARQYPYLRLAVVRGGAQLQINKIRIESQANVAHSVPAEIWLIEGELAKDQNSVLRAGNVKEPVAAWEFERSDSAPISSFNLHLGENTYGGAVKFFTRAMPKGPWELVHQGLWFNTQIGNAWQQSKSLSIDNNIHAHWRVELTEAVRARMQPSLEFRRIPEVLKFIANQHGPYHIALDQQLSTNHQHTNARIFMQLAGKQSDWDQVELLALNPDAELFSQKEKINWATWIFWGVLLGAVAILIGFAVRLFKHMNATRDVD